MPTLQYKTNLKCQSCVNKLTPYLDADPDIASWSVDTSKPDKMLSVKTTSLKRADIQKHVEDAGFKLLDDEAKPQEPTRSFWETYQPLLLIVGYLLGVVAIIEALNGLDWMRAMRNFMAGFFLVFSFFKLLNWSGFADAYQTYDIVAMRSRAYAWLYPLIELGLGVAYLTDFVPVVTNSVTLVVMLLGIIGVTRVLLRKQAIQCACLGTVFNLPMSKVTFIEDGTMAIMAGIMLAMV